MHQIYFNFLSTDMKDLYRHTNLLLQAQNLFTTVHHEDTPAPALI